MADNDLNTMLNVDMTTLMGQLKQIVDNLAMGKQSAKDVTFALQQMKTAFGQVGSERINTNQFKQLMTEVKKIASLGMGDISSQFQVAVNNAMVSGIKAQLKATQEAITAEINKAMREMSPASLAAKDVIGAGKYTAQLAQASRTQEYMSMQKNPTGYLRDNDPNSLSQRAKAQEEKVKALEFTKASEAVINSERVLLERILEKRQTILAVQKEEAEQAKKLAQEEDKRLNAVNRINESIQHQRDLLKATDDPNKKGRIEENIAKQQVNLARVTGNQSDVDQALIAAKPYLNSQWVNKTTRQAQMEAIKDEEATTKMIATSLKEAARSKNQTQMEAIKDEEATTKMVATAIKEAARSKKQSKMEVIKDEEAITRMVTTSIKEAAKSKKQSELEIIKDEEAITKMVAAAIKEDAKVRRQQKLERIKDEETTTKMEVEALKQSNKARRQAQLEQIKDEDATTKMLAAAMKAANKPTTEQKAQSNFDVQWSKFNLNGGADLMAVQGRVLANYQLMQSAMNGFKFSLNYVVELEAELAKLQGITGTTIAGMVDLKTAIVNTAMTSKYATKDIAEAATLMAQAGYSAATISTSLKPITEFATSTGTQVKDAVDMITSAMTVFSLRTEEAGRVADMFTAALNNTKLDPQKLAMGLQYVSNVAAQSNVTLSELTTVLGALSNAGIKSGSMAGTGLRQLMIDLSAPNKKLVDELYRLGLTEESVNIKTHGLVNVLSTLQKAGFTTASAMKTLEVRSANVYSAMLGQLDTVPALSMAMNDMGGAAKGNAVNMNTLEAAITRFKNSWGTISEDFFDPALKGFKEVLNISSDLMKGAHGASTAISAVGAAITLAFGLKTAQMITTMGAGLIRLAFQADVATKSIAATGAAATMTQTALASMVRANAVILGISLAFGALTLAVEHFSKSTKDGARSLDEIDASLEKTNGRLQASTDSIKAADTEIMRLAERGNSFKDSELPAIIGELRTKFGDMGISIADNVKSMGELIEAIIEAKRLATEGIILDLQIKGIDLEARKKATERELLNASGRVQFFNGAKDRSDILDIVNSADNDDSPSKDSRVQETAGLFKALTEFIANEKNNVTQEDLNRYLTAIKLKKDEFSGEADVVIGKENREKLIRALDSMNEMISTFAGKLSDNQKSVRDDESNKVAIFNKNTQKKADELGFTSDVAGLTQLHTDMNSVFNDPALARDLGVSAEIRKQIKEVTLEEVNKIKEKLKNNFNSKEMDTTAVKQIEDAINGVLARSTSAAAEAFAKDAPEKVNLAEAQISLFKRQLKAKIGEFTLRTTANTDPAVVDKIAQEAKAILEAERGAARDRLRAQRGPGVKTKIDDQKFNESLASLDAEYAERAKQISQQATNMKMKADDFHKSVTGYFANINASFSSLTHKLDKLLKEADYPLKDLNLKIESAKSPINKNNVSKVDIRAWEDQRVATQASVAGSKARTIEAALPDLQSYIDKANAKLVELGGERDAEGFYGSGGEIGRLKGQIENEKNLDEKNNLLDKLNARQATLNDLVQKQEKREAKINELKREREELVNKEASLTDKIAGDDFMTGFNNASKQWMDDQGLNKSFINTMKDELPGAFTVARDSFAGFTQSFVTNSKNVGSAALDMGRNVLKAMLQISTNQLAGQLMKLAFSGISAAAGPGVNDYQTTGTGPDIPTAPDVTAAMGGPIRDSMAWKHYAAGSPGGVPGRDSVRAMLMPGEYVLRKSAVDLVGRDTLDTVNAMGNRIAQGVNTATPSAQLPSNDRGSSGTVNVWVVSPDQVPPLGRNDIIATVEDNISRKGSIRQLIKSVQMGN